MAESKFVFDVTEAEFSSVVARSREVPIVLDFWAGWCQPCRMLTPVLVKLAEEYGGKFLLGKVNVDDCPYLASQFQVSGIPMVVALVDGKVVSHFTGVVDEAQARRFFDSILPSSADQLIRQAADLEATDPAQARSLYETALKEDPKNSVAQAALAALYLDAGDAEKATQWAEEVSEGTDGWTRAQNVMARLEFLAKAKEGGTISDCKTKLATARTT
ncbi:MAG: thioredoxin domain-containing protein [Planctomycetota bacterium]